MKKRVFFVVIVLLFAMTAGNGQAFVPEASHLLYLVMGKIKQPSGLKVYQIRQILNYDDSTAKGIEKLDEELIYDYPGRLRTKIISDAGTGFSIESELRFVKVMDGRIVSKNKSAVDFYTDILLYRDHESLLNQLENTGIDTLKVSFQRYNDTICYLIGSAVEKEKFHAGLWIEKDSFLPVRYVIKKNGWVVEFFYNKWQRISRTWYPMQISIFLDNQLFAMIHVKKIELASGFSSDLFDIDHVEKLYPANDSDSPEKNSQSVDELDKGIEEFKKLYE